MPYTFSYIGLCLIIGLIGRKHKFGFWGHFFCSLALTPIIGILLILAAGPRRGG